jgi:hypothetical protein
MAHYINGVRAQESEQAIERFFEVDTTVIQIIELDRICAPPLAYFETIDIHPQGTA